MIKNDFKWLKMITFDNSQIWTNKLKWGANSSQSSFIITPLYFVPDKTLFIYIRNVRNLQKVIKIEIWI